MSHLAKIVESQKIETSKKIEEIEKKTKLATKKGFIDKIEQAKTKITEYEEQRGEGPHIEKLITKQKNQIFNFKKELEERLQQIQKEFVTKTTIELIGIASIKSEIDANVRRESDLAGMKAVIQHEMKRASTESQREKIIDVSERDTGYDVESFDRCIEVKSFKKSGPAKLTSHEWKTAERLKGEYWLYVVEDAQTDPKITEIQNPYETFKDSVKTEQLIDYRYVIENWKNHS